MMDWSNFEAKATRVLPQQELKPKRCWIGVLSHVKSPEDDLVETDFVWMTGHAKISTQKLYDTYHKFHNGIDILLKFKDSLVEKNDSLKSFMTENSLLVLFTACLPNRRATTPKLRSATSAVLHTPQRAISTQRQAEHGRPSIPTPLLPTRMKKECLDNVDLLYHRARSSAVKAEPRSLEHGTAVKNKTPESILAPNLVADTQIRFDPATFFNCGSSPVQAGQEEMTPAYQSIQRIIDDQDPRVLEAGVAQSMVILKDLKQIFTRHNGRPDALAWIEAIDKLIPQARRKRTIVGVVGNTGAGKSSVINAMLDEERLVPTNCMRACTAVVTEMSYNANDDPNKKYHAQIEFITRDDWAKEVTTLMKEFLTESGGVVREASDEDSDAGIAWAKFHSVYPKITRDSLADCTVESLLSDRSVLAVLGTTKTINSAYLSSFYRQLQRYVDSKEKVTKKCKDKGQEKLKNTFEMEYWPLIKVVKISVKAEALSTGVVIVDLPGVHDSNAARAAVAQRYMKQCNGLWIVAPITRAVDDKAAKTLLGDTFKRQLKFEGGFSSVTFICSKTDDISITEAIDTLELEEEVQGLYNQQRIHEAKIEDLKTRIDEVRESQDVYRLAQKQASKDMETWEELKERKDDGQIVYTPQLRTKKRKSTRSRKTDNRKRCRATHDDSDDDFVVSDDETAESKSDSSSDEDICAPQSPLSEVEIKMKLKELKDTKKGARREIAELGLQLKELKPQITDLKADICAIQADVSHLCIAGRNDYSRRAIQRDFAAGLKELDQENAAEEDEANFNPDEEMRDYEHIANSLPVFCVSSRAYQKMCGRLQKDDPVPGFKHPEETEMPQLQAHCQKLTEAGRIQTARTFLLSLCQQLTTFSLWASDDGTGLKMTDDEKQKQIRYLDKQLSELERGLEESVRACLNAMKQVMNDQIFDRYPGLISDAIRAAPDTARSWGAHKTEGGLFWATYKATVRRNGQYHSSTAGHKDFNADLVSPIVKKLATGWERAFQARLPQAIDTFTSASSRLLHVFHQAIEARARSNGVGPANLATMKGQIHIYEKIFQDFSVELKVKMTVLQRDANRDFTPTIANLMHTVYETCADERGTGSFTRMKEHMLRYVDAYRHSMFNDATLTVQRNLDSMCKTLEELMEEKADEIFIGMKRDYQRVLGGGLHMHLDEAAVLPKAERDLRSEVMEALKTIDTRFEPIARGEIDSVALDNVPVVEEEHPVFASDDENENAFEPVGPGDAYDESTMDGIENSMITEPTPSKYIENKEKWPLPGLIDEDLWEAEEI
ncbi:hypothetical protein DE146DRAFT_709700 [Phaeosphaeria sp. MPI-PUGE-AT-0046c]|nr:hypothetical protein DE146DRAFT_709700 [Phaeosphaeria sp. MPI-PUGE-AT-0046c]